MEGKGKRKASLISQLHAKSSLQRCADIFLGPQLPKFLRQLKHTSAHLQFYLLQVGSAQAWDTDKSFPRKWSQIVEDSDDMAAVTVVLFPFSSGNIFTSDQRRRWLWDVKRSLGRYEPSFSSGLAIQKSPSQKTYSRSLFRSTQALLNEKSG